MRMGIGSCALAVAVISCQRTSPNERASAACFERGQAAVHVVGAIECRPFQFIRGVDKIHDLRLVLGKEAKPLPLVAIGNDGKAMSEITVSATVRDTSIVVVRDGRVYPVKPGRTVIDLMVGCETVAQVTVFSGADSTMNMAPQQLYTDTLRLAGSEQRAWKLPAGSYSVDIVSSNWPEVPEVSASRAKCRVRAIGSYDCDAESGASIVARNQNRTSHNSTASRITIIRTDGPPLLDLPAESARRIPRRLMCKTVVG